MCNLSQGGFRRPTPAGDLPRASHSCGETRTEEMKRSAEGLTPPPDIVIPSFSHHIEEEGNNAQQTSSLGAAQSALSASRRKTKIKEQWIKKEEGWGERYRQQGEDKVPYALRLYSPLLDNLYINKGLNMHKLEMS